MITQRGRFFKILIANGFFFVAVDSLQLLLQPPHFWRRHLSGQPGARSGFVDDIDCLVREKPVGYVALRELGRPVESDVGNHDTMVILISLPQALENLYRLFDRWRLHDHRLEPTFQRTVFFYVLAVFVQRRGPNTLQLATGQRRLQHVGCVYGTLGGTRTDEGVKLVNEEDHVLVLGDLVHDRLQPLFELPAVFGARDHRRHVEGENAVAPQGLRTVARGNELSQTLNDSRLAHSRLADQHRIVLLAPREHLYHALDLTLPPNRGI